MKIIGIACISNNQAIGKTNGELIYQMNYDINAGESTTIEFTATEAGTFDYLCTFHKPTMSGQLIII